MSTLDDDWHGSLAYIVVRMGDGSVERVREYGDVTAVRPWASVSKMAVAMAFGVEMDWELHTYSEMVGPRGANFANLLSHSSGLGLEDGDPIAPVGTKRIYSNYGVDYAVAKIVGENPAANWLEDRVFSPLGMTSSALHGRAAAGVRGSTEDMEKLAIAWLRSDALSAPTRDRMTRPYLPELAGIVPGFGRFTPCPWGMGPEIRGQKSHWMGEWLPSSFGHFGMSGSLMLLNVDEGIGVVATTTEDFGPWAVALWPQWTSAMRVVALRS
ncbi:MAG TPA: serine hydrolase domain-containing protein [Acidimicrobiales bacterium]|nr:serine hydrolase domain-containing protein [Acidimicrobiales bacterium]